LATSESFLQKLGIGIKDVFNWLAGTQGKAIVGAVEGTVETIAPGLTGIINIVNAWFAKAVTVESIAVAADSGTGTGTQKAAILLNDLTPTILADAQAAGLPAPTAATLAEVNNAVITILNLLSGVKTTTTTPAA
jgi:hypothetical protein